MGCWLEDGSSWRGGGADSLRKGASDMENGDMEMKW